MDFTVVIPVYNSSAFIRCTLESVAACAGNREFEVILVDDCSEDIRELKSVVSGYFFVKLIEKPKKTNASDSRNIGLARASAPFVFFLDSDDCFIPGYVDRRMRMLMETGAAVIFGDYISVAKERQIRAFLPVYTGGSMRSYLFVDRGDCRSSTVTVNKQLYCGSVFDDELEKHQDWGFLLKTFDSGRKIAFDDEPGVLLYVHHSARMSSSFNVGASRVFVSKYLSEKKHINGFARKHWKSALVSREAEVMRFFFGIHRSENLFSVDTVRYCFYKIAGTFPFVIAASGMLTFLRRVKWRQ